MPASRLLLFRSLQTAWRTSPRQINWLRDRLSLRHYSLDRRPKSTVRRLDLTSKVRSDPAKSSHDNVAAGTAVSDPKSSANSRRVPFIRARSEGDWVADVKQSSIVPSRPASTTQEAASRSSSGFSSESIDGDSGGYQAEHIPRQQQDVLNKNNVGKNRGERVRRFRPKLATPNYEDRSFQPAIQRSQTNGVRPKADILEQPLVNEEEHCAIDKSETTGGDVSPVAASNRPAQPNKIMKRKYGDLWETADNVQSKIESSLSLFEELFPGEAKNPPKSAKGLRRVKDGSNELPRLPPPDLDSLSDALDSFKSQNQLHSKLISKEAAAEAFRKQDFAVLILSRASVALCDADFRRIIPKGEHIGDWKGVGDILKGKLQNAIIRHEPSNLSFQSSRFVIHRRLNPKVPIFFSSSMRPTLVLIKNV